MLIGEIILVLLLLAVFAVLVAGVALMGVGGTKNLKYSNKFMIARITLQGLALVAIAAIYLLDSHK